MKDLFENTRERGAILSACRKYRYELWRFWGRGDCVMFIGLNPSTADESQDDPTLRRCIGFAKTWGFSGVIMTNLFAFRATDPESMKAALFPIGGLENDLALRSNADRAALIIAAWGVHGSHQDRDQDARKLIPRLHCIGKTQDGHPRHPLYVRASAMPEPFP